MSVTDNNVFPPVHICKAVLSKSKGAHLLQGMHTTGILKSKVLLILTVLLYKCGLEEKHVSAGILTVYILSTLAGGFVAGKMARVRKFVWGLGIGVLYFLLLVLISFGIYHSIQEPFPQLLIVCILCTGGGMIGGMIS